MEATTPLFATLPELQVRLDADVSFEHWNELYAWLVTGLLKMRSVARLLDEE